MNRGTGGYSRGRRDNKQGKKSNRNGFDQRDFRRSDGAGLSSLPNQKEKHPRHLKGKAIGMFYAKKAQENRKARELETGPLVKLTQSDVAKIYDLLRSTPGASKCGDMTTNLFTQTFLANQKGNENSHFGAPLELQRANSFQQDSNLDQDLKEQLTSKDKLQEYQALLDTRKRLPTWSRREEIVAAVRDNQVVVICGETGCGKTTQVGQYLLDEAISSGKGSCFHAICTQPRRIAAISVAQRVAHERCEPCGGTSSSSGYQIRLERKLPRERGSILFCTTGILVQFLQSDPYLENVSHLLLGNYFILHFFVCFATSTFQYFLFQTRSTNVTFSPISC